MSYKVLQLSPPSTDGIRMKLASPDFWGASIPASPDVSLRPCWLDDDDGLDAEGNRRVTWGTISGLALAISISTSFWVGLAVVVGRVWK